MAIPSDLDIARAASLAPLTDVAARMGVGAHLLEPYGDSVAKIKLAAMAELADRPKAKYVVVTAITPTPLGEGKTATLIGLGQAFSHIGRSATIAMRQPSMGPTFGIKGGAAGGGFSQVVPMDRLNLHLTGDFHAVTAANNMLAALVDNELFHTNDLDLDPRRVTWRRAIDINDRALRHLVIGLGGAKDGVARETGFDITAASEVMAILALASSPEDLGRRLSRIVVGYSRSGAPVTAEELRATGAMRAILQDAVKPNLMQTLENTPVLVHAGPFGNIAHGNSSIIADLIGIHTGDFLLTEAGFGADMGAERFFDIKCRASGLTPDAAVLVATVRGLKAHSGRHHIVAGRPLPAELLAENPDDVRLGASNLRKQIANIQAFGVPVVVAVNAFASDHPSELGAIIEICHEEGVPAAVARHVEQGGRGAVELAERVVAATDAPAKFQPLYRDEDPLRTKIETVARRIYGASDVSYSSTAAADLDRLTREGRDDLPVCIAKTHLSLSSDPSLRGAPTGWTLPVREVRAAIGAGFAYPICGDMQTMPGLGAHPAAHSIGLDDNGDVTGLSQR